MTNNPVNKLKAYLELGKIKIMIPVCLTGFTGYFIFDPRISLNILLTSLGILFLAVSASVLNQIQEAGIDAMMDRTRHRPIPAGTISKTQAFIFFLFSLLTGFFTIYYAGNLKAAIIGLITLVWYNAIYTCSKRVTAFAVVPGAITGALPPLIGWVAAGGAEWARPIVFLEFIFFSGQIPHFWLLILKYGEEYKTAGIPSLTDVFSKVQINRLTFTWVLYSAFAALFLAYFGVINSMPLIVILLLASIGLIWQFSYLLRSRSATSDPGRYSLSLNLYFLLVLVLLITDRVLT